MRFAALADVTALLPNLDLLAAGVAGDDSGGQDLGALVAVKLGGGRTYQVSILII